ncbi:MAG: hypothetical protein BGO32_10080 [Bacteroidetes bacterium 37-13]|nr:MAG: hypothetical protein BGO32_10080 [Bacteroidetes bacterium 37-13]
MVIDKNNIFVFVVCGSKEHIDTLHFSLKALKKFSKNKIIVLTDSMRNEIPIAHDNVIDIKTPEHFNHHQASIYLKTGINKFLPQGNLYCYLDTDVVALSSRVDDIFSFYIAPISFTSDHCKIDVFSPSAVNCGCKENYDKGKAELDSIYEKFYKINLNGRSVLKDIDSTVLKSKSNKFVYLFHKLQYALPLKYYYLNSKYKFHKKEQSWYTNKGQRLTFPNSAEVVSKIEDLIGFTYDFKKHEWFDREGNSLSVLSCEHLLTYIEKKFAVKISGRNWQHWNGGVFLFDDSSADFLNAWHEKTMLVFQDKEWKTRDQGTLAATVWEFNLQEHPLLPIEYNFLADYNNVAIIYENNLSFNLLKQQRTIKPEFIHIYHNWGDKEWQVWRDVETLVDG